jgi:hypothetical protein
MPEPNLVYIIEKIWIDPMENHSEGAVGYNPIGFVLEEQAAIEFCKTGRDYTSKDCWAIGISQDKALPEFKYEALAKLQ